MAELIFMPKEIKTFTKMVDATGILDKDSKSALFEVRRFNNQAQCVAERLCKLVGPFIQRPCGTPVVCEIIRSASDEFCDKVNVDGIREAYHRFFMTIMQSLPELLDYVMELDISGRPKIQINLMHEDAHTKLKNTADTLRVYPLPIKTSVTRHELSLLMASRVFSREDFVQLGVPGVGFNAVVDMCNSIEWGDA